MFFAAFIASHDGLNLAAGAAARMEQIVGDELCSVCGEAFRSRNLLFVHIKKTGHATAGQDGAPDRREGKRGRRRGIDDD